METGLSNPILEIKKVLAPVLFESILDTCSQSTSTNSKNYTRYIEEMKILSQAEINDLNSDQLLKEKVLAMLQESIKKDITYKLCSQSIANIFDTSKLESIFNDVNVESILKNNNEEKSCDFTQKKRKKNSTKVITCEHTDAKYYAKGLCYNCYQRGGRKKVPWNCEHINKPLYALGRCHNCYQNLHKKDELIV